MKKRTQLYSPWHIGSSILMLALLTWLTVCLPFANKCQQLGKAQTESSKESKADDSNPLTNTNEEKCEGGSTLLSEYLHEVQLLEIHFVLLSSSYRPEAVQPYLAFHPDLFIPPPEA